MGISTLLMGVFFDFYFDLNDDTMMRDIMSGVYSGTPDGHNMQTLYPLGVAIALCYRLNGSFPWYGGFLFLCQFGCFFAVGARLCMLADAACVRRPGVSETDGTGNGAGTKRRFVWKLLCLTGVVLFQWGIWLTHTVNVQYTITGGMLAGTAVFLYLTMPHMPVPPLLLFLLAFQLRSEMALLLLPFLGLAGAFCWWEDRPVFSGKNLKKYGGLLLLLLAGMGLSLGTDALAYGGEWRTFRQFFDDRTTIYDFYPEVVTQDGYGADLEELGVAYGLRILLENYNFGLDERIDAKLLSNVAVYAKEHVGGARDWGKIFKDKLLLYRYRSFHGEDAPYNVLVWLGYAANIIAAVILICKTNETSCVRTSPERAGSRRRKELCSAAVQLFLLFLVRSALWMFILLRGRDPERITHPLYLVEFCLLAGMFLRRCVCDAVDAAQEVADVASVQAVDSRHGSCDISVARSLLCGAAAVVCLLSAASMIKTVPAVRADQAGRQETGRDLEAIDAYCRAHADTFYFEDVYSTVAFSGKLLEYRDNTLSNYDIAGGWMCKSPLYREKLSAFGIEDAAAALAEGKADFIMSDEEVGLRGLTWFAVPYAENGMDVYIEEYDRIGENYGVYQVIPTAEDGRYLRETKWEQ